MKMGDAYVIVYSVTDKASFEKASELRIQLRRARQSEDIPIILVGNKSDLVRSREVSVEGEQRYSEYFTNFSTAIDFLITRVNICGYLCGNKAIISIGWKFAGCFPKLFSIAIITILVSSNCLQQISQEGLHTWSRTGLGYVHCGDG